MIDDEKLDLSALDPARDPRHWQAVIGETLRRVDVVLAKRSMREIDAFDLIASWRRSLVAAAALVLAVLIPAEIALEIRESRAEAIHRLAVLSASSAQRHQAPTAVEIFRTIANEGRQ
jgi:hypothetical protein